MLIASTNLINYMISSVASLFHASISIHFLDPEQLIFNCIMTHLQQYQHSYTKDTTNVINSTCDFSLFLLFLYVQCNNEHTNNAYIAVLLKTHCQQDSYNMFQYCIYLNTVRLIVHPRSAQAMAKVEEVIFVSLIFISLPTFLMG